MALPAGIAGQLGFKSETVVGTPVTVDQFSPVLPGARIAQQITRHDSQGIRAGRHTVAKWKAGGKLFSGPVPLELYNQPLATLLKHMFGNVATTGAGPFTHTATPADLTGKSLTMQLGLPDVGGTVDAFTYAGVKIPEWEISAGIDEIARLNLGVAAMSESTATALATASYAAGISPFVFREGSIDIGGGAVNTVKQMTIRGANNLPSRLRAGSATSREYLQAGRRDYGGQILTDFESLTAYNRFVNGTEAALVFKFDNGTDSLTITCNVRFDGETPELRDDLLEQPLPFVCLHGTSDASAITAVLVNAETSAA